MRETIRITENHICCDGCGKDSSDIIGFSQQPMNEMINMGGRSPKTVKAATYAINNSQYYLIKGNGIMNIIMSQKRTCESCKALILNNGWYSCELGYDINQKGIPLEHCPKPKTYMDEFHCQQYYRKLK